MSCVLGREIVSIKGDLLSLSLSLCLAPRSVPSSFCPLFNTLARKTQEYHARTPQLGFFDFNHQKHSHSSKHKTNNRRKMPWLPQALGKSLCWDKGPVVTVGGLCLLLSSLQMKLAFPSTKSIYIFAHSRVCHHVRCLGPEFFLCYYWWILKWFLACITSDADGGIHILILFVSLCVC